jgi:protein CpxP
MNMTIRRFAARAGAVALCSAALCTVPMMAQGGGGGGRMMQTPDDQLAAIDKAVTLTSDQKPQVKAILDLDAKKRTDMMAAQDPDMRAKMTAMRTDEQTKIKAILTDDQKAKYDAYLASMPRGGGRGGGGGAPGGGAPPAAPPQ